MTTRRVSGGDGGNFCFRCGFAQVNTIVLLDGGPKQSKCVAAPFGVPGKKAWCLRMLPIYRISHKQMAFFEKRWKKHDFETRYVLFSV